MKKKTTKKKVELFWKGPFEGGDGITFSLLSKFLVCRERFRLMTIEGLEEDEGFRPALEYGSLWHEAEEAFAAGKDWKKPVRIYRDKLLANYPADVAEVNKWFSVCMKTFPIYVRHWKTHKDTAKRKPLLEEYAFRVPYKLPSGRVLWLKGKFDCVFLEGVKRAFIMLQENKTKGRIDEQGIQGTVDQNLQTMLYQIALRTLAVLCKEGNAPDDLPVHVVDALKKYPIKGVLYNVCRRPLADLHAIKQRKGREVNKKDKDGKPVLKRDGKPVKVRVGVETDKEFFDRLAAVIKEDADNFFMRWKVLLTDKDVERFKTRCFHPVMEQLADWYEWISAAPDEPFRVDDQGVPGGGIHWQAPWGVYDSMFGGFRGDFFELLTKGSRTNLKKKPTLFPEL